MAEKDYNAVGWFEIYVDDISRARKFYETVFDVKMDSMPIPAGSEGLEMITFPMNMDGKGAGGAICKMEGVKPGGNGTLVYFTSEDCAIEEARVSSAGGSIMKPKMSIGEYGFISLVFDTEGNLIGIHSLK